MSHCFSCGIDFQQRLDVDIAFTFPDARCGAGCPCAPCDANCDCALKTCERCAQHPERMETAR